MHSHFVMAVSEDTILNALKNTPKNVWADTSAGSERAQASLAAVLHAHVLTQHAAPSSSYFRYLLPGYAKDHTVLLYCTLHCVTTMHEEISSTEIYFFFYITVLALYSSIGSTQL